MKSYPKSITELDTKTDNEIGYIVWQTLMIMCKAWNKVDGYEWEEVIEDATCCISLLEQCVYTNSREHGTLLFVKEETAEKFFIHYRREIKSAKAFI